MCWSRLVIIKILLFGQKNEQIFHILSLFDVSYAAHMISTHFVRAKDHGLSILRTKDHGLLSYAQRIMDFYLTRKGILKSIFLKIVAQVL